MKELVHSSWVPLATVMDIENKSFGSGNISIQTECSEDLIFPTESVTNFFEKIVRKESPFTLGTVATSVRVFNLNRDDNERVAANMTIDYRPEIEKDLWLWDVRKNQRGKLVTVGCDWNLAIITGAGKSIDEAVGKMYRNVEGFAFVGAYYRSKDDYLSLDYSSSIINCLNYGLERGLYRLPFDVKVGEILAR